MMQFTLAMAETVVDGALAHARKAGLKPLAVVVLDAGAHLIVAKREDGTSLYRIEIASAKARGALGMGCGSRELARRAAASPEFFDSVMAAVGKVILSPGGVLIRDREGHVLGAVGISGDTGDADEAAALAGLAAADLRAQPAE
jgi:uncharacterized protein GlcG (DUF336 family)